MHFIHETYESKLTHSWRSKAVNNSRRQPTILSSNFFVSVTDFAVFSRNSNIYNLNTSVKNRLLIFSDTFHAIY